MRSAASRAAAEAAAKPASLKKPSKIGDCPRCGFPIYVEQKTAWASLDGKPVRVHRRCYTCPDCGQPLTPNHTRDTGDATTLPEGSCLVLFERRNRT